MSAHSGEGADSSDVGGGDPQGRTTVFASNYRITDTDEAFPDLHSDRYRLQFEIDRGGMGVVYAAQDQQLDREVVVKVLRRDFKDDKRIRRAFKNEAIILGALTHPGIPPVYESGRCADKRPFHVMKWVRGKSLYQLLSQPKPDKPRLLSIFAKVCDTMAFAHATGVIHLDLKPANIMVGRYGEVQLMDWGLARRWSAIAGHQSDSFWPETSGQVSGTPSYMSPEQATGGETDMRSDVFGLGAILSEILIGIPPYHGDDVLKVFQRARRGEVQPALRALANSYNDRHLIELATRCLAAAPDERPNSAVLVAQEMSDYETSSLHQMKNDMHRFFELSLDLFCICSKDGYFRRINANFERVLGFSDEELMSRPFIDFVHEEDRKSTIEQMGILNRGQPVVRFRNRYRTAGGRFVTLEWTAKTVDHESVIFAVARDVTTRAMVERQKKASRIKGPWDQRA